MSFFSSKGIEFLRQSEDDVKPRVVLMSTSNWGKIIKNKDEILHYMSQRRPYTLQLADASKQLVLEEFEASGMWFVGFHSLGMRGVLGYASMNFNLDEFTVLLNHVDEINTALARNKNFGKKSSFGGRDRSGDEQMLVFGFIWRGADNEILVKSEAQFNREIDCREGAERAIDRSDPKFQGPLRLEVWSEFVDIWHPKQMVRWVFYAVAWGIIQQLSREGERCSGCVRSDRVLKSHRCLSVSVSEAELQTNVRAYLSKAKEMVSVQTMTKILDEVRKRIGGSAIWAYVYAETFLAFAEPTEAMVRDMVEFLSAGDYSPRFATIRKSIMSYLETFVFSKDHNDGPPTPKMARQDNGTRHQSLMA